MRSFVYFIACFQPSFINVHGAPYIATPDLKKYTLFDILPFAAKILKKGKHWRIPLGSCISALSPTPGFPLAKPVPFHPNAKTGKNAVCRHFRFRENHLKTWKSSRILICSCCPKQIYANGALNRCERNPLSLSLLWSERLLLTFDLCGRILINIVKNDLLISHAFASSYYCLNPTMDVWIFNLIWRERG